MSEEPKDTSKPFFNFSASDLFGLGKGVEKLLNVVGLGGGRLADGVSRVAEAKWLARTDADNEAYRIRVVGTAQNQVIKERMQAITAVVREEHHQLNSLNIAGAEVSAQLAGLPPEVQALHQRSLQHQAHENILQQLHRETVIAYAAVELEEQERLTDEQVSETPVEPDWTTRFLRTVQDISNEEMQVIFGKILAGEVRKPGSFSPRTIDFLATLTKEEALTFQKLCGFVWDYLGIPVIVLFESYVDGESYSVDIPNEVELRHLASIGLIEYNPASVRNGFHYRAKSISISYNGSAIDVESVHEDRGVVRIGVTVLTALGRELAGVCQPVPDPCMMEYAINGWMQLGHQVSCLMPVKKPDLAHIPGRES